MNKLLTILILISISTTATAEWTLVQTGDNGSMYIDFDSLQKTGDLVTVLTLNDYYEPQQKDELSAQFKELHDCRNKKFKALSINYYSSPLAQGNMITTVTLNEPETPWSDVVQYSIGELKANIICSR
jgi:spermidine/putrescine-binding protein